jgi:quinol-cytochrome oxidoreductase complex cytochrome b subunit
MNGVAFFFIAVYIHIAKALYYGSYKYQRNLICRFNYLLCHDGTGFLGYVLPYGQMSFYGALLF